MLRGKKNFARPGEKRTKHIFLREIKRFLAKEKLRAKKKEVIVAPHLSERIIDFDDDDDEDFFSSFPQNSFIIAR